MKTPTATLSPGVVSVATRMPLESVVTCHKDMKGREDMEDMGAGGYTKGFGFRVYEESSISSSPLALSPPNASRTRPGQAAVHASLFAIHSTRVRG
jgi:hypothetical protein